ncbi:Peptidyl-prolyl cis-trans isomerase [Acinetobacter baumannii]|nr:Peptidyl-prolyl cis-trans isomerase [Acinetobacter baumannii]
MITELEIIDLKVGEGKEAVKGALITTHYTGWLEDGTKFDSSLDRGNYFEWALLHK